MGWNYIEKNEYPKENGTYLVSCIAEEWEVEKDIRSSRFTEYACYSTEDKCFHNDNGYNYNVYAWRKKVEPAEPLYHKDWRDFFVDNKSTYDLIREYCRRNNLEIKTEIEGCYYYYAYIEVLCTLPEEDKIDTLIEIWEQ